MKIREVCTWLVISMLFAGASCSTDKPEEYWGYGELSSDGKYGLFSRYTRSETSSQFISFVFEVARRGEPGHGIIDTLDVDVESPVFCSDSEVAHLRKEGSTTSLVVRRFLPPKTVTVVHQHLGDTSTMWLEQIRGRGLFDFFLGDSLIAHAAIGGIEIRRLNSLDQSTWLGYMHNGQWPSFSHDGSAAYCIEVTQDSLGEGHTWPYSFNVDSGYFELLCDTSRIVDYAPQSVTIEADVYYLVRQPFRKTKNVWVCDRAGQSRPVTFFEYPQLVSAFSLTESGIACWIEDAESRLPEWERLHFIPLEDSL